MKTAAIKEIHALINKEEMENIIYPSSHFWEAYKEETSFYKDLGIQASKFEEQWCFVVKTMPF